jgi:hypothetical protein
MTKNKTNEVVYHVLSHHVDHYIEVVGNMGNCTQNIAAQVGFIAGEPDVSITFE